MKIWLNPKSLITSPSIAANYNFILALKQFKKKGDCMKNIKEIVNNIRSLFNKKSYNEKCIKEINKQLENSGSIIIKDPFKKDILILNPRLIYNSEKSTNTMASIYLTGNIVNKVEIDFPTKFKCGDGKHRFCDLENIDASKIKL